MLDPEVASAGLPVLGAHHVEEAVEHPLLDAGVEHLKELGPDLNLQRELVMNTLIPLLLYSLSLSLVLIKRGCNDQY